MTVWLFPPLLLALAAADFAIQHGEDLNSLFASIGEHEKSDTSPKEGILGFVEEYEHAIRRRKSIGSYQIQVCAMK
jgi:hypothetical protein